MRRALFALLAVLLLAMQHEGLVHPLVHFGSQLERAHDTGLTAPQAAEPCVECALLAAGGNVAAGANRYVCAELPTAGRAHIVARTRAADAPAWFHSRAPPSVLL